MKIGSWILIGLICLFCAIVFYPYFEVIILISIGFLLASYWHYWKTKSHYGPYLYYGPNPATSMWINFILVSSSDIFLKDTVYAEISQSRSFHNSNVFRILPTEVILEAGRVYIHILCDNLASNICYYYRIGYKKKLIKSGRAYHFHTMIDPCYSGKDSCTLKNLAESSNSVRFIIYGDDQTADFFPILAQVTNHYQYAAHPEFIVHLGDINQNLGHDQENNAFFQTKQKLFNGIPYLPVIGNHDAKPISRFNALYNLPHWYIIDYGSRLRILCVSGYDGFVPHTNGQYEFIEANIQAGVQENRFIIFCTHEHFFSIETNIPEEKPVMELRQYILPLLRQYNRGLQRNIVIFSGHIHEYSRIVQDDLTFFIEGACSNAKWYSKLHGDSTHSYDPEIIAKEYGRQSYALLTLQNEILTVDIRGWGKKQVEFLEFCL
jgi:predicted phosphodiesterase